MPLRRCKFELKIWLFEFCKQFCRLWSAARAVHRWLRCFNVVRLWYVPSVYLQYGGARPGRCLQAPLWDLKLRVASGNTRIVRLALQVASGMSKRLAKRNSLVSTWHCFRDSRNSLATMQGFILPESARLCPAAFAREAALLPSWSVESALTSISLSWRSLRYSPTQVCSSVFLSKGTSHQAQPCGDDSSALLDYLQWENQALQSRTGQGHTDSHLVAT